MSRRGNAMHLVSGSNLQTACGKPTLRRRYTHAFERVNCDACRGAARPCGDRFGDWTCMLAAGHAGTHEQFLAGGVVRWLVQGELGGGEGAPAEAEKEASHEGPGRGRAG